MEAEDKVHTVKKVLKEMMAENSPNTLQQGKPKGIHTKPHHKLLKTKEQISFEDRLRKKTPYM